MNPLIQKLLGSCESIVTELNTSCTKENLESAKLRELEYLDEALAVAYHKLANKRMAVMGLIDHRKQADVGAAQLGGS